MQPNFALTPSQSFSVASISAEKTAPQNITDVAAFNLREARGPMLADPLPEHPEQTFMIYAVVQVLDHEQGIPKGFVNRTTWVPQSLPLISLNREEWNDHQLVPWTGSKASWVELTINNIDGTGHPFHLVSVLSSREVSDRKG